MVTTKSDRDRAFVKREADARGGGSDMSVPPRKIRACPRSRSLPLPSR